MPQHVTVPSFMTVTHLRLSTGCVWGGGVQGYPSTALSSPCHGRVRVEPCPWMAHYHREPLLMLTALLEAVKVLMNTN